MALRPSGFDRDEVELVVIETSALSLYIKGKPYHARYKNLQEFRKQSFAIDEKMAFSVRGTGIESVEVFDIREGRLMPHAQHLPIFFENGIYQLVASSKNGKALDFHHEHPGLRRAVGLAGKGQQQILMGNLQFINEVGLTTFEILDDEQRLLEVTLEVFPSKLDYKEDYRALLQEVNEEIYNLAYHFIKKTHLGASSFVSKEPAMTEFYRLLDRHFNDFLKAIARIREQPHHALQKSYQKVRGDQLRRLDAKARRYLRRRAHLFQTVPHGIPVRECTFMPVHGLNVKKTRTFDTLENRFVKWMMTRLGHKLDELHRRINTHAPFKPKTDPWLSDKVLRMKSQLKRILRSPFWQSIGQLDRSVTSLVMQMKPGYKEALQIYLVVSRGLTLEGHFYNMSVKDVATLYEYWAFLKLGQILAQNYEGVSQNIVKITSGGLFVNLDQSQSAKRVFRHPHTNEEITLYFQKRADDLPTVRQKPDTVLAIEKKGKTHTYQFIFDAKYRIDFAAENSAYAKQYHMPGPLEEDINMMHRYRDALVVKQGGPYEREAFGAYVLFPWADEDSYEAHHFYRSIDKVNIGGLPFLPNTTRLVEQFLNHLIEKSPEAIQREGILPKGAEEEWRSTLDEKVLIGTVKDRVRFNVHWREKFYHIPVERLRKGWHEAKYLALYLPRKVTREKNGIYYYGKITDIEIKRRDTIASLPSDKRGNYAVIRVERWCTLDTVISPVGYGIVVNAITTLNTLKQAKELPELFMKSKEEMALWRMLRRLSNRVRTILDKRYLDQATAIQSYAINDLTVIVDKDAASIYITRGERQKALPLEWLNKQPTRLFKEIASLL